MAKLTMSVTTNDSEWQRMTTNHSEWQQMTDNKWQRVTTRKRRSYSAIMTAKKWLLLKKGVP